MFRALLLATCVTAISLATAVRADEPWRSQLEVGDFDVFHKGNSAAFDLQLRPGWRWWDFGTFVGVMATTKDAIYGYGGFTFDLKLTDHWLVTEDEAVGMYSDGSDKKLGNNVEFRSGVGVGYEFDNGWRAGVALHHISNAGLGKHNPGVEIAAFTLAVPLFGVPAASEASTEASVVAPAPAPVQSAPAAPKDYLVFFDFDKSDLTAEARGIVKAAADNASATTVTRITVTGHTDTVGSDAYNMRLSKRRAVSVRAELVHDGVRESEIAIFAKGKREPLVPTADGVREPQNRRVEIVLQ